MTRERLEAVFALRDAGPGLGLPALDPWSRRVRRRYLSRDFEALLDRIERGPIRVSPWRWPGVENAVNLLEYFVHTEDGRRARPGWSARRHRLDGPEP